MPLSTIFQLYRGGKVFQPEYNVYMCGKLQVWLIDIWCLTPLSAIFQLYHGDQFWWWKKPERTTDHGQATGKLLSLADASRLHPFWDLESHGRTNVWINYIFLTPLIIDIMLLLFKRANKTHVLLFIKNKSCANFR